ncbi:MAG: hypothetical protein ACK4GQ_04740, partial [Candidatus Hadarchaeales archaeon]
MAKKKAKREEKGLGVLEGEGGLLSDILGRPLPPGKPAEKEAGVEKLPPAQPSITPRVETGKIEAKVPLTGKTLAAYRDVEIISAEGEEVPIYKVRIPELTPKEKELLKKVKEAAVEEIKVAPDLTDPSELQRIFSQGVLKILEREARGAKLPPGRLRQLGELAVHDMIGFGVLDPLLADDQLEDIMVT